MLSRKGMAEAMYAMDILAAKFDAVEAFRDLVSAFVFLLCREAFGRVEALDELVCAEDVFL